MNTNNIEDSAIKGYLFFKRRPQKTIGISIGKEDDNMCDPSAMVVRMPSSSNILGWGEGEVDIDVGKIISGHVLMAILSPYHR